MPTIDSCSCAIFLRHSEAGSAGGVDEILAAHFQAAMNQVFFFFVFPICFPSVLCIVGMFGADDSRFHWELVLMKAKAPVSASAVWTQYFPVDKKEQVAWDLEKLGKSLPLYLNLNARKHGANEMRMENDGWTYLGSWSASVEIWWLTGT